ncbi:MAG TPA: cyclodeaminase/cyclohydrolase family protein [Nocardioidaceae bacterium]|nr:cyclodeaminase/cyclohydrolase family protein [Nocardioidaceae bacterium]
MTGSYLDHGLGEFLELVAKRQPAPGGGAVAALTVSAAAGLVAMAARYSADRLDGGEALVDDAERLRAGAADLADADADAYGAVIAAFTSARDGDEHIGREQVRVALTRAAEVPLEVAELGAGTARLASRLAAEGKRDIRGDATTALLLAEAATRSAAHLVGVNVRAGGGDEELVRRAAVSVATARDAAACVE